MQPIRMENEQGKCVGFLLVHKADDIVSEEQLLKLKPYVQNLMSTSANGKLADMKDRFKIVKLSDTKAAFVIEGAEEEHLHSICNICRSKISEPPHCSARDGRRSVDQASRHAIRYRKSSSGGKISHSGRIQYLRFCPVESCFDL